MTIVKIGEYVPALDIRPEMIAVHGVETCYIVRLTDWQGKQITEYRTSNPQEASVQFKYAQDNGYFAELNYS